ncbi:MAG: SET domain-containing protein-lysine N-methyltransferase [Candidatus Zixiibacteriota bacterium]
MRFIQGQHIKDWVSSKITIQTSPIHGKGMVAAEPITEGEIVIIWGGRVISRIEFEDGQFLADTACRLSEELYLADDEGLSPDDEYFLNHSCEPNLGMRDEITLVALIDILPGTELTIDYAMWECDPNWSMSPCACGSQLCRGHIKGSDWQRPDLQIKYKGLFTPYIQSLINTPREEKLD